MAGVDTAFNQTEVEAALRFAMNMGMPVEIADRLTWHWNDSKTYTIQDVNADPYNWTASPVTDVPGNPVQPGGSLQVLYALESTNASSSYTVDTSLGQFDPTKIAITLLDTEFQQIKTADYITMRLVTYDISFVAPPLALFSMPVWTVYAEARDSA